MGIISWVGLTLFALFLFAALMIIFVYFKLVYLKFQLKKEWDDIVFQLKARYDLVPTLVSLVAQYDIKEKDLLENIVKFRVASMSVVEPERKKEAEDGLTQALKEMFDVVGNYPDLKKNESFLTLKKELDAVKRGIQLLKGRYSNIVRKFNSLIGSFPYSFMAKLFGFSKINHF